MRKLLAVALAAIVLTSCAKEDRKESRYQVNEAASKIEWKGSATDHFHVGKFDVKGSLVANGAGSIKNGEFVIPISSIEDYDLPDPVKEQLLTHLKSPDFFNMVLNPNAKFSIQNVSAYNKADSGAVAGANYMVTGNFTMVGETRQISFPAKIITTADSLFTVADLTIDRTKWGMTSYSDPAAALYILPGVNLHLDIHSAKLR